MTSDTFRLRAFLAAPPEAVYRALTDPTALRGWLAEHAEVSLPDKHFAFWGRYTPHGDRPRQRLRDAEPDRLLRFAWDLDSIERVVEIELSLDPPTGTVLSLSQTGATTYQQMHDGIRGEAGVWDWRLPIANLANYLEGRALAPRLDFTEQPRDPVEIALPIDAPAEQVFAALIRPEQLDRWLGSGGDGSEGSSVDPRVGGEIRFSLQSEPVKILELEPDRRLAYSWRWKDQQTAVRWELEGSEGKTHLTIVHSGFGDDLPGARQHHGGWLCFLAELRRMLELGTAWRPIQVQVPGRANARQSQMPEQLHA